MTSLESRLDRIEAELDRLKPSLGERLDRLEQAAEVAKRGVPPPRSARSGFIAWLGRFVSWMGAELPKFLTATILLGFGWGIKDSVDLSIKQRQLDLSYAKELQGLLQTMGDPNADMPKLESTAVALASYGDAALPSLLSELRHTGLRADAAAAGIASLALANPRPVCDALPRILGNHAHQYDWQSHLKVIRLLGENGCVKAAGPLSDYRKVVASATQGNTAEFEEIVSALPPAPAEDYARLLEAIDRSMHMLGQ